MAKVKIRWKKIAAFVEEIKEALSPLVPVGASFEYTGSSAIDKEGTFSVGGKAEIDIEAIADGVPVSVEGGVKHAHDNQGRSDTKLVITFGPPPAA